jgi:hypothetical protein
MLYRMEGYVKKLKKQRSSAAASVSKQAATMAALQGRRIGSADLERITRALENLVLIRDIGPQRSPERKRVLADIETMLFSHLGSIQPGRLPLVANTPSGANWVSKFPDSKLTSALTASFRGGVDSFIGAMTDAGASVSIGTTLRPPERAYLMYNAWRIANAEVKAEDVPTMDGVDIEWVHSSDDESVQSAQDMVDGYQIVAKPALNSRHTQGRAIDMTISWSGTLSIANKDGTKSEITSTPRTGENSDLIDVGAAYGVIKATFTGDPPHWSDDGH